MHRLLIVTAVLLFSISNFGSINAADPPRLYLAQGLGEAAARCLTGTGYPATQ